MRTAVVALAIAGVLLSIPMVARAEDAPAAEVAQARAQIDATMAQMRTTAMRVREQLRITRRHGSRRQIVCVDEALSRSDAGVRRARETAEEMLGAYERGELDTARGFRLRLAEIREGQRMAAAEGAQCVPAPPP